MTSSLQTPDLKTVQERARRVQKICQRADAGILLLDDLISQLEEEARTSPLHQYRLQKAGKVIEAKVQL